MVALILASRGRITNAFGAKNPLGASLKYHQGVDTGHGNGLDILAPAAGFATRRASGGAKGTYGNYWVIVHDDGTQSLVAHLDRHIGGNRYVYQGEVIGVMGNTGTTFVHCHQEYRVNGIPVDPTKYLASVAGDDPTPIEPPSTRFKRRRRTMLALIVRDGRGLLGPVNATRTYIVGPGWWLETTGQPTANYASVVVQGFDPNGNPMDSINCNYDELHAYALSSKACPPEELERYRKAAAA